MGLGRTPTLGRMTGTTLVVTTTFANRQGALYLVNTGDNDIWIRLDGTAPVASDGAGRIRIPADTSGEGRGAAINLDDIDYASIKAISTAAFSLQYVATERPGNTGG